MPFAGYASFAECVAKNQDKGDPEAYCAALKRAIEGRIDASSLSGKVEETPDYFIIRDSVATREGVFNGTYRPWQPIRETYKSLDGKPIVTDQRGLEGHQFFGQVDRVVLGIVRDVRLDEEKRRVLYDAHLWRQPVPGFRVTQDAIRLARLVVDAVKNGDVVGNSIGFLADPAGTGPGEWNGTPYEETLLLRDYEHVAILSPVTQETPACRTEQGCGIGVDTMNKDKSQETKLDCQERLSREVDRLVTEALAKERKAGDNQKPETQTMNPEEKKPATEKVDAGAPQTQPPANPPEVKNLQDRLKAFEDADQAARVRLAKEVAKAQGKDAAYEAVLAKAPLDTLLALRDSLPSGGIAAPNLQAPPPEAKIDLGMTMGDWDPASKTWKVN